MKKKLIESRRLFTSLKRELSRFDEIAESFGYSRASLIREVIKVFNENSMEFMKKIHKL